MTTTRAQLMQATLRWCLHCGLMLIGLALAPHAGALDLNTADRSQLEQLPRVGVARADVILQERQRGGPFVSWDDFRKRVPGYGEKSVQQLKERGVTIDASTAPSSKTAAP